MKRDLEKIHQEIQSIQHASETLASKKDYTSADVLKLQGKLHKIDAEYKEGVIVDRKPNKSEDPYEVTGQGQVADDLATTHSILSDMLAKSSE